MVGDSERLERCSEKLVPLEVAWMRPCVAPKFASELLFGVLVGLMAASTADEKPAEKGVALR